MKTSSFYEQLSQKSLSGEALSLEESKEILTSQDIELLPLLHSVFQVRQKFWGRDVTIHIINNAQNGNCPEDCAYCAQAKTSEADIEDYPVKEEEEIMAEAKRAYEAGAYRYCMVFSGRGPRPKRVETLARIIEKIKATYPIQVCLSAGLVDHDMAKRLKHAGLDRLNHNLNTSEDHYKNICTTHTFQDRLNTLTAAQDNGLEICSGMIAGMGEAPDDVIEVAMKLRSLKSKSIPLNFLLPIPGTTLKTFTPLTPDYCLRIITLFRFLNPEAEIRIAAGREFHLRSMQVMGLYPASSMFMDGYLNTTGTNTAETLQMIKDAGFTIRANFDLDEILAKAKQEQEETHASAASKLVMKQVQDLRPTLQKSGCL
jgi:biotin synthase